MSRYTLRFSEPPLDLNIVESSSQRRKSKDNKGNTRGKSAPGIIDSNSPVFQQQDDTTTETSRFVQAQALQPSDVVEFMYSHALRKSITNDQLLFRVNYPVDIVVSRPRQSLPLPLVAKRRKRKKEPPVVICLDDSSSEEEDVDEVMKEDTIVAKEESTVVTKESEGSCMGTTEEVKTHLALADPKPLRQKWVMTSVGPGKVCTSRIERFAVSPCTPHVMYKVQLASWGTMYTRHVESLQESDYGRKVLVTDPKLPITNYDLVRLWPGVYLNERLVMFYMNHIMKQYGKDDVYIYSTYFYSKIALEMETKGRKRDHLWTSLQRWTKNVDIWSKRLLLIPIHGKLHWSLAVIYNPGKKNACLLHLDSGKRFQLHRSKTVFLRLRNYLKQAMNHHSEQPLSGFAPQVPQQKNAVDCGLFMLEFVERIVHVEEIQVPPKGKKDFKPFCKDWFDSAMVSASKRREMEGLIREQAAATEATLTGK